ncbi:biotin synthase BioB [Domibacillus sp. A3M-37]|uniref:biotin synthase BioB n=1 Tax=Domibacillus sp. A3M-37 TaxID=2962037 RepID=UPI0020B70726|nr:biotin synthase BioB [Domibacillus sp. A3M-37]MCP3762824.1 biotin synthase BioB [Domibacillus sp. A3M-37]
MSTWTQLAGQVLNGYKLSEVEAIQILECPEDDLLQLLDGAFQIRRHYYGKKVKLNMIINTKSGLCPEDCGYCSQSSKSTAPIEKYRMMDREQIVAGAEKAHSLGANTYCIVASGRGPSKKEIETVTGAVKEIKEKYQMRICACLGILKPEQAAQLKEAGVDRYNHNINTSKEHHSEITTTHTYNDRTETVGRVKESGMSPCSGVIIGMGETNEDIVNMAFSLRELDADSIPVNFLHAIPGTKLEHAKPLTPSFCLKVLALFRFINPSKEIRISGGREVNLRSVQPLGLYAANSIFLGNYLTTAGQETTADHKMIEDMGFIVEHAHEQEPVC